MKRQKQINAFFDQLGLGLTLLDPIPTSRPPSLGKAPKEKLSKNMKRLMKQNDKRIGAFQRQYAMNQFTNIAPFIHQVQFDPAPQFFMYY
jgi:hypothetical protein